MTDFAGHAAAYALRIEGAVGPVLQLCLRHSASGATTRTEEPSVVLVAVTDDDLVDVAGKLISYGVEIDSLRAITIE
jgi:hypothetical protein